MKGRKTGLLCTLVLLSVACTTPGTRAVRAPGPQQRSDVVAPPKAEVADARGPASGERDRVLLEALRSMSGHGSERGELRVFFAFEDLNDDGVHEAVVHMTGSAFCGTGGCTTMVYQWDPPAAAYVKVEHSPTTRPPIYASRRGGCQWSMLWVQRSGGGRATELHSPNPLSGVDSCDAPVGTWNEAESKLLIPVYVSRTEGTAL